MRVTTVFNKLLALQGALVREVEFGCDELVVTVARRAHLHRCPRCGYSTPSRYDSHVRDWRHVALGKWRVILRATLCRLQCPEHGVVTEAVPWAAPDSRFTLDFEMLVAWCAREMNKTAVTRLLHIAWVTVGRIVERVVGDLLDEERLDRLFVMGIDEVSYRKGHKYLTVIADHQSGQPVWIAEGRSRETVGHFFDEMGPERSKNVLLASMDMSGAYIAEVTARAPYATIAFDPFHVVKLANEAVHEVRRSEVREQKGTPQAQALKGSRWALLKAPENLDADEELRLSVVARMNRAVYRAYLLKEELRALYQCSPRSAPRHLDALVEWAQRSRLPPFVKLGRTLRQYREGILAAIRFGLSNGRMEGLNNKIGVIKRRAYGFHSAAALIAMVFLCCSQLPITLPI